MPRATRSGSRTLCQNLECVRSNGERAATESEQINVVVWLVDAAQSRIEIPNVARQSKPGRPGEQAKRSEALGADAVVVDPDLRRQRGIVAMTVLIDRLVDLEDVRPAPFDCRVACAVGTNHDVL